MRVWAGMSPLWGSEGGALLVPTPGLPRVLGLLAHPSGLCLPRHQVPSISCKTLVAGFRAQLDDPARPHLETLHSVTSVNPYSKRDHILRF